MPQGDLKANGFVYVFTKKSRPNYKSGRLFLGEVYLLIG